MGSSLKPFRSEGDPDPRSVLILGADRRGESALQLLPDASRGAGEELIAGGALAALDCWTAVCLRARLELHARQLQHRVTLELPRRPEPSLLLRSMLGELPAQVVLGQGASVAVGVSRAAILPAQRIESRPVMETIADDLPHRIAATHSRRCARLIAGAFAELVDNALRHARDSPISTVAGVAYEPTPHALQLVVVDLGRSLAQPEDTGARLLEALQPREGALRAFDWIAQLSKGQSRDVEIAVASGGGRLRLRGGEGWVLSRGLPTPGFAVGVTLRL